MFAMCMLMFGLEVAKSSAICCWLSHILPSLAKSATDARPSAVRYMIMFCRSSIRGFIENFLFKVYILQKYDIFLIQANNPLIFTPNRNSKTYRPLNTKSAFGTISLITGESFGSSIFVRSNSAASNNLFIQRGLKDILKDILKDTLKDTLNDTLNDIAESILGLSNIHVFVLFFPQILLFSICQHALSLLFHLFSTVQQAVLLSHKDNL